MKAPAELATGPSAAAGGSPVNAGAEPGDAPALRIVHVLAPAPFGGLERVVQALVRGHRARGHAVSVAAVLGADPSPEHPFLRSLELSGATLEPIRVRGRHYRRERALLRELLRRTDADVVHTHGYRPDVLDAGVAQRLGLPVISTVHGFTGGDLKNRVYEWAQRRAYRRFDAVVAVSSAIVEALQRAGVAPARIHLLPNAWEPGAPPLDREAARRELGIPPGSWCIGFAGRLSAEKGADVLVEALARLGDLPLTLSVLGEGGEARRLRGRARALGIAERIRWHGVVADAARLFPAFDAFALSSRTEGTPIALFEAMAAGVPVVASRVGGVPAVVGPREALLVEPGDPAALASALRSVHADGAAATVRAAAARQRLARDFALQPWLEAYESIYRELKMSHARTGA